MTKKNIIALILFFGVIFIFSLKHFATQKEDSFWPIENCKPLETHWSIWMKKIICVQNERELAVFEIQNQQYNRTRLYRFNYAPEIIRHLPLKRGELIVAISNRNKRMNVLAYNDKYALEYENSFPLNYEVSEAQIRIDTKGQVNAVLLSRQRQNNIVTLWRQDSAEQQLLVSEHKIEQIFYHEEEKTIHFIKEENNQKIWMLYKDNRYYNFSLKQVLTKPVFFNFRNTVYLLGVDPAGNLWKSQIRINANGQVTQNLLLSDDRLRFVDEIIIFKFKENITLLAPIARSNLVLRYTLLDFENNVVDKVKNEKIIFHAAKIHPIHIDNDLALALQNDLNYVYYEPWQSRQTSIINFQWRLDLSRSKNRLVLEWQLPAHIQMPLYSYVFDQKKDTTALPDKISIANNRIEFEDPADGQYVFHLQLYNGADNSHSPLYHIPIFWQFIPPEPRISLLNRVTPIHLDNKPVQFLINNLGPYDYYAEINEIPGSRPEARLEFRDGLGTIAKALQPGLYYLHIRAKDRRSLNFSTVYSERFFIWPFTAVVDCNTDIQAEVSKLLYRKNQSNDDKERIEILQQMKLLYQKFLECKKSSQ